MKNCKSFVENLRNGNIEGVQNTLKEEFVNKSVNEFYSTFPINIACKEGFVDIVNLLLQHNCNIECEDKGRKRPIHYASEKGHVEIVKLLLLHNCNIECESEWQRRPIHYASDEGHVEIVKLLLQHNCNIECENFGQRRPIHYASEKGHVEIVKLLLLHNCNIECEDKWQSRPIHYAIKNGHVEIVKLLLQHNCNIEYEDIWRNRLIHYAIKNGNVEIVKLLLQHNCNIECEDKWQSRPIHYTIKNGHVEIVKLLLQHNCNIECKNERQRRPIHYASENGHVEIVKLLLLHNCNIECEDKWRQRPIHYAIKNGHFEIVKLLLQHNCNIECKTNEGYSPIEIAKSYGHKEIINILNGRKLLIACKDGIITNLPLLLTVADIEYCDEDNRRPIHWACQNGHIEIVKLLIKRNCNIDATDNSHSCPMAIAQNIKNKEIINILTAKILDRPLRKQISMMGLTCKFWCDHKLCPKSLREKTFHEGSKIGKGAFGKIFRCKGSGIDREFAIKRIKFDQIDANSIERNINKFLPALNHVRIVQYFGAIQKNNYLYIFMEFLPEGSLQDKIIKEKFIKPENIIFYSKQILEGLEFLHGNKIIHRDLKPANILMDDGNNIKLADFGIGRSLIGKDGISTVAHTAVGTYNFTAPEVINNEPHNVHADIWSLGATIINMITGKPPYHDYVQVALIYKIASTKKLEISQLPPIPNEMKIFIESMLNPDPKSRPTATELLKLNLFSQ